MATFTLYNTFKEAQLDGNVPNTPIDFDTDVIKLALVTSSYVPSQLHDLWNDANANEVTGTNYTAGGETLTMSVTETNGIINVDGSDVTWLQSGTGFSTARYGILYKDSGVASTSPLIGYIDFLANTGNTTTDLVVQWDPEGIFVLNLNPNNYVRADTTANFTAGYTSTSFSNGTITTGTVIPDPADGNFQHYTNGGAHTLSPPTSTSSIIIEITNNASAGAITLTGFDLIDGSANLTTVNGDKFIVQILKTNTLAQIVINGPA